MKEVKQSFHREDSDDGNFFNFLTQFTSECGYFAAIKETCHFWAYEMLISLLETKQLSNTT